MLGLRLKPFRLLAENNGIQTVCIKGGPLGVHINFVTTGGQHGCLHTDLDVLRIFPKVETVFRLLHGCGINRFTVDLSDWKKGTLETAKADLPDASKTPPEQMSRVRRPETKKKMAADTSPSQRSLVRHAESRM